jgi:probable HAF family extracellular repeat protein
MRRYWVLTLAIYALCGGGLGIVRADVFLYSGGTFTTILATNLVGAGAGINSSGQIVGTFIQGGLEQGFLDIGGVFTTLDDPNPNEGTLARNINDAGQIVGAYYGTNGYSNGFLYSGGKFTTIDFPGALETWASGINDSGQIVGTAFVPTGMGVRIEGFLYSSGSFTPISPVPLTSNSQSQAAGINDSGQIVGDYFDPATYTYHSFLYSGGVYTTIGGLEDFATDINDSGEIVGVLNSGNPPGLPQGFLDNGGTITTISDPGSAGIAPYGINNSGQIVGDLYGFGRPVPEPSSFIPLAAGVAAIFECARRRNRLTTG